MSLWFLGHCRQYVWVRRSHSFFGLIPHFGIAERAGWRYIKIIEYVPPKRDLWTSRNVLVCFEGHYRVWHVRVESVRRLATREQALADFYFKGR